MQPDRTRTACFLDPVEHVLIPKFISYCDIFKPIALVEPRREPLVVHAEYSWKCGTTRRYGFKVLPADIGRYVSGHRPDQHGSEMACAVGGPTSQDRRRTGQGHLRWPSPSIDGARKRNDRAGIEIAIGPSVQALAKARRGSNCPPSTPLAVSTVPLTPTTAFSFSSATMLDGLVSQPCHS